MENLLEIRNLQLHFDTEQGVVEVIDGIDMTINRGMVMGLVGESGCGKTTIANAILGVLPATTTRMVEGEILFKGRDLLRTRSKVLNNRIRGRAITFIPQDPLGSFNPLFPIEDQLMEIMKWKSRSMKDQGNSMAGNHDFGYLSSLLTRYNRERYRSDYKAVTDMLRVVQIPKPEETLKKYPYELSGGQRQRIMIAIAILPEPDLIIADEPTTALDVTIQAQILRLFKKLTKEKNISVLFTTHDLGTAYEICDEIWVMYAGQLMEVAPKDSFFNHPCHPYTRKLIESLPHPDQGLVDIPGAVPSLINPPSGCRFHPRCDYAMEICRKSQPEKTRIADQHIVRCYRPLE